MNTAIQEIDQKIEALRADLLALQRTRALLNGSESHTGDKGTRGTKTAKLKSRFVAGSGPDLAHKALREAGNPLHFSEIVAAVAATGKRFKGQYLANAIYRCARKHQVFTLKGHGKFGLLEWSQR